MSIEENKTVARRYCQAMSDKDLTALDQVLAPNLVIHLSDGTVRGIDGARDFVANMPADTREIIEDMVGEGDKVTVRLRYQFTHDIEFRTPWGSVIPPTGKQVSFVGVDVYRIAGGRVAEEWTVSDFVSLWQQLGAIPTAGQAT